MSQVVKGVIARVKGAPVETVDIVIPDPGPGEAVVQVQSCGVCHTDLHYREGGINDEFPFLLGHEAAGIVESVGEGVTSVAPGDFVILNWRAVCGQCRACKRGDLKYCFNTHNATQKMTIADGEDAGVELSPALGIGAFAEKTLVAAGQCTKVDPGARPAAVGLLGCGVMAGLGAAINTGQAGRGKSLAVIGCGGVGVAAIAGGKLAGALPIIAIDIDAKKLEKAREMGATHVIDSSQVDPVTAVAEICDQYYPGAEGADVVVEAVGRPETWKQAFYARDLAGTVVLVGVPNPEMRVPEIPLVDVFGRGGALKSSWYGDCLPEKDFPMLVDLYRNGQLDLDAFVTEEVGIDEVEASFEKMHHGQVLRSVVVL
ncbi:MAG: S-(hydroxymethyl)mycothiol dehydrogenase [Gordonia sp. (in: high G+C Gram-positive bacteria)]|uniref:S-(hydroxymethyl)mycothiol dehydrogenase n=1 Tax=Gordonia sp. (in: high G+C Gram-positive bacteria) TaxID=84139 RepID=UPI0039E31778